MNPTGINTNISTPIGPAAAGGAVDYGSVGANQTAQANLAFAARDTAARAAQTPTTSTSPATVGSSSTSSSTALPRYSTVVTSTPATNNLTSIANDYYNNIQPSMSAQADRLSAQNQLPVMEGYDVSTNPTTAPGSIKVTSNTTGQVYYATPKASQASAANDVISAITGGTNTPTTTSPTSTPTGTVSSGDTSSLDLNPSGIDINAENNSYNAAISQASSDLDNAYNDYKTNVTNLMNGVFPLTSAQQALVDSTTQAFDTLMSQENLKAAALSSQTGGVSSKVNATMGEVANIDSQKAAAIAKLEIGFQQQNYQLISDSYDAFTKAETAKTDMLTKLHDSIVTQYQNAQDTAIKVATFNETQVKDATELAQSQYEFRDMKDAFGQTIGTEVYDKSTGQPIARVSDGGGGISDPSTGTLGSVSYGPDGSPTPSSQQAYLQTIPAPYRAMVEGIADGTIAPPRAGTAKGAQILSWVAGYDPSLSDGTGGFDATKFQARQTFATSLASYNSGSYGSGILAANKVIAHLASFYNSSLNIPGKEPFGVGNQTAANLLGGVAAIFGNTSIQANTATAETEANGVTDEMAKFFKGTGTTDVGSIDSWSQSVNPFAPSGTLQGSTQGALNLFSGQVNTFIQQYTTVMGQAPNIGTILQPQTLQTLSAFKNAGFNVDIPGVLYTDPKAYIQSDPEASSKMDAARQMLIQANDPNNPATPENILQAAQLLP